MLVNTSSDDSGVSKCIASYKLQHHCHYLSVCLIEKILKN